ncbi:MULTISPECIES: hypothetical protein [unclassified Nonomuraea]
MFAVHRSRGTYCLAAVLASTALTLTAGGTAAVAAPHVTASAADTSVVKVREGNYFIALSRWRFRPGSVTFRIKNVGSHPHGLSIRGPGVSRTSMIVPPGGRTALTVTLKHGRYLLWCPVDQHRQRGMWTWIGVG